MKIQLRQICLVAQQLEPVLQDLTSVLGIHRCFVDPGVGKYGLENTLMPIGRNFLEVVAPVKEGTAGGRYLERRNGDGGYMVICQADHRDNQQAVRQRALDNGVRIANEGDRENWGVCQIHPGDMIASFFEIDWDSTNDFLGNWEPAGGHGWEHKVDQSRTVDYLGVELQGDDPNQIADLWAKVSGIPVDRSGNAPQLALNNAVIRFVGAADGRGPGLGGIDLAVRDRAAILDAARERGCYVADDRVDICGTRFYLRDEV